MNDPVKPFDERRDVALPGNHDKTIDFAVKHFVATAQDAIEKNDVFCVALSGGSTPKKIFEKLAQPVFREAIDWNKMIVFWGDERPVPPEHEDSNYNMAMRSGFKELPIPKENIFRMEAESDMEKHAKDYETLIRKNVKGTSFDLIMLGMGDDGHTASLFPNTQALEIKDQLVVANEVPQKKCYRMTFTYPLINNAKNIALYVLGEAKQDRLTQVLMSKDCEFPSCKIGTIKNKALWILDDGASTGLLKVWT